MCGPNLLALWVVLLALVRYESMGAPSPDPISTDIFNHWKIVPMVKDTNVVLYKPISKATTEQLLGKIEREIMTNPQLSKYKAYAFLLMPNSGMIMMAVNDFGLPVIHHVMKSNPGVVEKLVETFRNTGNWDKKSLNELGSGVIEELKSIGAVEEIKILEGKELSLVEQGGRSISGNHVNIRRRSLRRGAVRVALGIEALLVATFMISLVWLISVGLTTHPDIDHTDPHDYDILVLLHMIIVSGVASLIWGMGLLVAVNVNTNTEDPNRVPQNQVSRVSQNQVFQSVKNIWNLFLERCSSTIRRFKSGQGGNNGENEKKIEEV